MEKLPQVCKDCAEYGSDFCNDCLEELNQNLTQEEKLILNDAIRNIAKADHETLGNKNTKDSK